MKFLPLTSPTRRGRIGGISPLTINRYSQSGYCYIIASASLVKL